MLREVKCQCGLQLEMVPKNMCVWYSFYYSWHFSVGFKIFKIKRLKNISYNTYKTIWISTFSLVEVLRKVLKIHTSMLRLERVRFASFWRVASTTDTGSRPAVWRILSTYRWFSDKRRVSFMRRPVSCVMGRIDTFSSKAISHVPLKKKKKKNYIL